MKKRHTLLLALLLPLYTLAWNDIGHSTGGAIAYYYLKQHSPGTIPKILTILKNHPWYSKQGSQGWADRLSGLTAGQKEVMLFMLASTFPDEARGTVYGHDSWHYIDYPFVPAGSTSEGQEPGIPNAQTQIDSLITSVPSGSNPELKALGLCWLFHLIEDVHQPLHATSMFTDNFPNGDRGGNDTYIQFSTGDPLKLHSYWDGLIKGSINTVPAKARAILSKPIYQESHLHELTDNLQPADWIYKESFAIAKTDAYKNGTINGTKTAPKKVNTSYGTKSSAIAEKRIVLAGIRLAKTLETITI